MPAALGMFFLWYYRKETMSLSGCPRWKEVSQLDRIPVMDDDKFIVPGTVDHLHHQLRRPRDLLVPQCKSLSHPSGIIPVSFQLLLPRVDEGEPRVVFEHHPVNPLRLFRAVTLHPRSIIRRGLTTLAEGGKLFGPMGVQDNLLLGSYPLAKKERRAIMAGRLETLFNTFLVLKMQ
jgi:hypothetical protein